MSELLEPLDLTQDSNNRYVAGIESPITMLARVLPLTGRPPAVRDFKSQLEGLNLRQNLSSLMSRLHNTGHADDGSSEGASHTSQGLRPSESSGRSMPPSTTTSRTGHHLHRLRNSLQPKVCSNDKDFIFEQLADRPCLSDHCVSSKILPSPTVPHTLLEAPIQRLKSFAHCY